MRTTSGRFKVQFLSISPHEPSSVCQSGRNVSLTPAQGRYHTKICRLHDRLSAIEHNIALLHNDRDFDPIEAHCGLKVDIGAAKTIPKKPWRPHLRVIFSFVLEK